MRHFQMPYVGMNQKVPKLPTGHVGFNPLQEFMYNPKFQNLGPAEISLLMRQLEMQYPSALRNSFPPTFQHPATDLGMGYLSGLNRAQPNPLDPTHQILGTPGSQSSFLKESVTPTTKHPILRTEAENGSQAKPMGTQKGISVEKNKVQKDFFESTERNIDKLIDCAELRLELPNFETFKTNKPFEPKSINENEYKNNKDLIASMMNQIPLQAKWLKDKNVNPGMTVETPSGMVNMEMESKALGVTKVQGKASDPICLD